MQTPGFRQQEEAVLTTLTEDVLKSSEIDGAEKTLAAVFQKADFWKKHAAAKINQRQRDMLNRRLDGLEGKLTSSKWAMLEKCSPDTALRDIQDLLDQGILSKDEGGGRSTSYSLATE
jgi:Fic family protein